MKNLESIIRKYSELKSNEDNYSIGGGLADSGKKASNRHEDALSDSGKLTFGKAAQMFKKATGCEISLINEIFDYAVPYAEWHHAGFLPKQYGGGMKKTYFLNSTEIIMLAANWNSLIEKLEISKTERRIAAENQENREQIKHDFLKTNAVRVDRVLYSNIPANFYETDREMNGKYGWFSSYGKTYNMTEYYSGWKFETSEKMNEFHTL